MKKLFSLVLFQVIFFCFSGFAYAGNIYQEDPDNYYRFPIIAGSEDAPNTIIIYCDPSTDRGKYGEDALSALRKFEIYHEEFKGKYKVILSGDSPNPYVKKALIAVAVMAKKVSQEKAQEAFSIMPSRRFTSYDIIKEEIVGNGFETDEELLKEVQKPRYEELFNEGSKAIIEKYNIPPYDYLSVNPDDPDQVIGVAGRSPSIIIDGHVYDRGSNGQKYTEGEDFNQLDLEPMKFMNFLMRVAAKYPPYNAIP